MQTHYYDIRIMIDDAFLKELLYEDYDLADFLLRLSHIHTTSEQHMMNHNKILDTCFTTVVRDEGMSGDRLLGAMSPEPLPGFVESDQSLVSQVIKFAINLADDEPYTTFIFTGSTRQENYLTNKHFKALTGGVQIASPDYADQVIDSLHPDRDGER